MGLPFTEWHKNHMFWSKIQPLTKSANPDISCTMASNRQKWLLCSPHCQQKRPQEQDYMADDQDCRCWTSFVSRAFKVLKWWKYFMVSCTWGVEYSFVPKSSFFPHKFLCSFAMRSTKRYVWMHPCHNYRYSFKPPCPCRNELHDVYITIHRTKMTTDCTPNGP